MQIYLRLLSYAKPYSTFVVPYVVFFLLSVILGAVNFTLLIPLFDILFNNAEIPTHNIAPTFSFTPNYVKDLFYYFFYKQLAENGKMATLWFVCEIVVLSVLLTNVFRYLGVYTLNSVRAKLIEKLRLDLFQKFIHLDIGYFSNERKGDLMSRIINDINQIEQTVILGLNAVFKGPFTLVIYFGLLFTISYKLTFFTIFYLPIAGGIITIISKKLRTKSNNLQNLLADLLVTIEEAFSGIKTIKSLTAYDNVLGKFATINKNYTSLLIQVGNRADAAGPISEALGSAVLAGILLYGGSLVLSNSPELAGSSFITYIIVFSQILPAIKEVTNSTSMLQRGLISGERVFKVIDTQSDIIIKPHAKKLEKFENEIQFNNISFSYDGEKIVLDKLNFTIQRGKVVALVGSSGSGKSTIADLLLRFYDVNEGEILIDSINLKDLDIVSLRNQIGIVSQEAILFNDTIFNNIAFGMPQATKEQVIEAAKIANAHDFIMQTDLGYDTNIGDRGTKLSGGQKQRLNIARTILMNPAILILDEATSALDSESEKLVQEALYKLMENRTSLVIAHRLSTIRHADTIIVLDRGKIVEQGNHDTLLTKSGYYKKFMDLQFMN
jgi:subfamily B ATP-binding cassette protein MsbA